MHKTVRKLFYAWQTDKEKKFLEDMALKGYILEKVGFAKYVFVITEPKKVVFQFDFRIVSKKDEKEYLSFYEDWQYVDRFGSWYYFYTEIKDDKIDYSLFSDTKSQRNMFGRLLLFIGIAGLPLYYQLLLIFPNMDVSESTFPAFYGFFRVVVMVLVVLHIIVCIKLIKMYKRLHDSIVE